MQAPANKVAVRTQDNPQASVESKLSQESQAHWDRLSEEINRTQAQLNGVKGLQGAEVERKTTEMRVHLNALQAARTDLKDAPQKVATLKGVMKRTEQNQATAVTQLAEAELELDQAQKLVDGCRRKVEEHTAELIRLQFRLGQAVKELPAEGAE